MAIELRGPLPVFPLPGVVLFPGALLPLHVFELRYRTMVRDALSGERLIALALLKPGYEHDYHGSPEFFPIGCLARFEEVEWLPNDCYDLKVLGQSRVRFTRIVREFPYRAASVTLMPEEPYTDDDPLVQLEKRALVETITRLQKSAGWEEATPVSIDFANTYETLVNCLCMVTDAAPHERMALLEMDSVIARGRQVRELTERRLQRRGRGPSGAKN
jgi:Lon protease-like protein